MKLHQVLFDEIYAQGVRHIFGIPGDFVLNLYEALAQDGRFQLVTLSHEPAVGFAADGASRITNGLGVCVVTYGAGGLNLLNSVACAYAEESPLIVITGGPGKSEKRLGVQVHHEVKSYDSQFKIYQEVTEFGAVLDDPRTAAAQIRKAIEVALKFKRPVYLEVPRDMVFADVSPLSSVEQVELRVDEGAVDEAAQEIVSRLTAAKNPVLIVGVEVHRFHLIPKVLELAERLQIPVTSSFLGRGVFPTRHPQFIGTYLGGVSPQPLREIVESSDCLLLLGELVSDTSLGVSADRVNEDNLIVCVAREVFIKYHQFQHTPHRHGRRSAADVGSSRARPHRRGDGHRRVGRNLRSVQAGRADQDEARHQAGERVRRAASGVSAGRRHRRCAVRERRHPFERMHRAGLLRDDGVCGAGGAGRADCERAGGRSCSSATAPSR